MGSPWRSVVPWLLLAVCAFSCDLGRQLGDATFACERQADCAEGNVCVDGVCVDAADAPDAAFGDAGISDAGNPDAGVTDAGAPDGGICMPTGVELCSDGLYNDCNGAIDCADMACSMRSCGGNGRLCMAQACVCGGGQSTEQTCDDGIDNDCNGSTDCADSSCNGKTCGPHGNACANSSCTCSGNGGTAQASETMCFDGKDNDCDGLIDCDDPSCSGHGCGANNKRCVNMTCVCTVRDGGTVEATESICNDGLDNDCNGLTDCAEPACAGMTCGANGRACAGTNCRCSGNGGTAQSPETNCSDGHDNDCNGLIDCADPACVMAASCTDAGVTYSVGASPQGFIDACALAGEQTYLTTQDDQATALLSMPIQFSFYGVGVTQFWVSSNGELGFGAPSKGPDTDCLPNVMMPGNTIFVNAEDLLTSAAGVCIAVTGTTGTRQMVVTWRNADQFDFMGSSLTFSAILNETSDTIDVVFAAFSSDGGSPGAKSVVAVEDPTGLKFTQFECNTAGSLSSTTKVRFTPH